ncbi:MAG: outer membrane lipoprotein carrier protein LolA [Deltaproteobacteria bacterium]|nr:outer membrane lipoprotein carrier protein LolA [Deltaproteobacteria bacterium]MBW1845877.1 outer membrane lipoprotein carrier protein LolA [Deltaproteobacteria bacterium]MBW2178966.1 outer membrane lipoprotein carrier protein LolA [Deltaproteobacteria bacterium]
MKRTIGYVVISIFVIITFGYVFAGQKDTEIIEKQTKTIKTVSAEFVQEKHLKILSNPLISKGKLYYQAPRSLRWEYFTPVKSILLVNKGKVKRYIIRDQKVIEDSSAKMQSMHIVMDEIAMWLSGRFDHNPDFAVQNKDKNRIVLKPVNQAFLNIINRIEIYLSDRPGIIHSVMIYESVDSYTRLEFKKVILNEKLSDSLFKEI